MKYLSEEIIMWLLAYFDTSEIDGIPVIRASGVIQFFNTREEAVKAKEITDIINDDDDLETMVFPAEIDIGEWHPQEWY